MKQKYAKIGLKFIKCSKCGTLFTGFIFETGKLCSKCGILKIAKQEYEKE